MNDSSILIDIKKLLNISEDDEAFDKEIILYINDAFHRLNQLGVGPTAGFEITSSEDTWNDFWGSLPALNSVPVYIYLYVRRSFDPPSGGLLDAINNQIKEKEWLLNVDVDPLVIGNGGDDSG